MSEANDRNVRESSPGPHARAGGGEEKFREKLAEKNRRIKRLREQLAERNERLRRLRERLQEKDREITSLRDRLLGRGAGAGAIGPENVVWIFGAGRTGSTWLASMMGELDGHRVWSEPQLGELFDPDRLGIGAQRGAQRIFALPHKATWLASVRRFILDSVEARFPEGTGVLVIKEPHGSAGAPLLLEALPESRVVLLVRDPRDAISSALDAFTRGMWRGRAWKGMYDGRNESPDAFVEDAARSYLRHVGNASKAYGAHGGPKVLVRYEDLTAGTLGVMKRVYAGLEILVEEEDLVGAVEKHTWEKIPEGEKGEGKFHRKGEPGSWKEDLTPEQVRVVEEITAPLLAEFYGRESHSG